MASAYSWRSAAILLLQLLLAFSGILLPLSPDQCLVGVTYLYIYSITTCCLTLLQKQLYIDHCPL